MIELACDCARHILEAADKDTRLLRHPENFNCAVLADTVTEAQNQLYARLAEKIFAPDDNWSTINHYVTSDPIDLEHALNRQGQAFGVTLDERDRDLARRAQLFRALVAYPDKLATVLALFDLDRDWEWLKEPVNVCLGFCGDCEVLCHGSDARTCQELYERGQALRIQDDEERAQLEINILQQAQETLDTHDQARSNIVELTDELNALEVEINAALPEAVSQLHQQLREKEQELSKLREVLLAAQDQLHHQRHPSWLDKLRGERSQDKHWQLVHQIQTYEQAVEKLAERAAELEAELAEKTTTLALAKTRRESLECELRRRSREANSCQHLLNRVWKGNNVT